MASVKRAHAIARTAMVYGSFILFLILEAVAIYLLYRYFGIV